MALQNGKKIALAQRRHRVIRAKIAGRSEAEIAEQEGVAQYTIWKDIRAYLGEVRREDKEAVQAEYDLQRARYERLLLRWWDHTIGEDSGQAARATGIVLDILRRLDTIGGLIPEKPLIQLQQQNVMVGGVTFADLLREAMDGAGEWLGDDKLGAHSLLLLQTGVSLQQQTLGRESREEGRGA